MSIRLEFELSREDWKEAVWLYYRKREPQNDPLKLLMYVGYAATALGFLLLVKRPDGGGWLAPVVLVVVGLLIPLRLTAVKFSQQNDLWYESERLIQPTVWEFDDDIRIASIHTQVIYQWGAFNRWVEGPTVILLYRTADQFHAIPKRAFTDPEQAAQLRRMLDERLAAPVRGFPVRAADK